MAVSDILAHSVYLESSYLIPRQQISQEAEHAWRGTPHCGQHSTQTCEEGSTPDEPEGAPFRHTMQQFVATQLQHT